MRKRFNYMLKKRKIDCICRKIDIIVRIFSPMNRTKDSLLPHKRQFRSPLYDINDEIMENFQVDKM